MASAVVRRGSPPLAVSPVSTVDPYSASVLRLRPICGTFLDPLGGVAGSPVAAGPAERSSRRGVGEYDGPRASLAPVIDAVMWSPGRTGIVAITFSAAGRTSHRVVPGHPTDVVRLGPGLQEIPVGQPVHPDPGRGVRRSGRRRHRRHGPRTGDGGEGTGLGVTGPVRRGGAGVLGDGADPDQRTRRGGPATGPARPTGARPGHGDERATPGRTDRDDTRCPSLAAGCAPSASTHLTTGPAPGAMGVAAHAAPRRWAPTTRPAGRSPPDPRRVCLDPYTSPRWRTDADRSREGTPAVIGITLATCCTGGGSS